MYQVQQRWLNVEKSSIHNYRNVRVIGVGLQLSAFFFFHQQVNHILFFPIPYSCFEGLIAFGLARKAQLKCKDGFLDQSRKLNKRALALCITSVICGVALMLGFFYGLDSWPRTNG